MPAQLLDIIMVSRIKTDFAARMGKYVNEHRRASSKEKAFAEAVAHAKTPVASGRRAAGHQPAVRSGAISAGRPQGSLKYITGLQARRLAGYAPIIQQASQKYNVPIELICGVILQESGGNCNAVSHCGARGLMQLMPATARRLGVGNSGDPYQNVMGGTRYLRMLLDRFGGNMALALAGYNAGEGNVEKYGRRIPPFSETRAYVPNVLKYADTLWRMLRMQQPVSRAAAADITAPPRVYHRTIFTRRA